MATALVAPGSAPSLPRPLAATRPDAFAHGIWQAPLVPVALAGTAGIVLNRSAQLPLALSLLAAAAGLVAWALATAGRRKGLGLVYLWAGIAALGAAYHHYCREVYAADDIGHFASGQSQPVLVRGVLATEPTIPWRAPNDPLRSFESPDVTRMDVQATRLKQQDDWVSVSGLAHVVVSGRVQEVHVGDEVEIVGWLEAPPGPANPGEFDYASFLRDQRINAFLSVKKTPEGVTRLATNWPWTLAGWLAALKGSCQRTLQEALPPEQARLAIALLLGESSTMTSEEWEKYVQTGVIHVLAISGQHLVVLAVFLWYALRLYGVRRRRGVWFVALVLTGYALLAGGRPPVLRSAVTVCALAGGLLLRRPVMPANSFALAWIVVAVLNPTDLFTTGCLLSFLSVAVLYWGPCNLLLSEKDPLERLIEESRPAWQRWLCWLGREVVLSYAITLTIWLAIAPLVAGLQHVVSPVGLVIGPPTVLLTSVALLSGFLVLLLAPLCWPAAQACAWVTQWSLSGCDLLVNAGKGSGAYGYVSDLPGWWLWVFYLGLLPALILPALRQRWRGTLLAGLAWFCVGLAAGAVRQRSEEFRCTFLAVGHGGCAVLELPDGRSLLYDTGAISGPEVTRRQIAPYLWHRGIRRIDEVFLSHADLDHFNGLTALVERFAVGQVTCTPTFANKTTASVKVTLATLHRRGIPVRIVHAGDRLAAGEVSIDVLHPPAVGPEGNENARSMVLLIRHGGHALLLTGDLEGPGLERVLTLPRLRLDLFMAPHHGSRAANKLELAAWARARFVVSCQEPPRRPGLALEPYSARGATYLATWEHGAVTVRSHASGLVVETFRSGQRWTVRPPARP
jgi:competence protein ComEC